MTDHVPIDASVAYTSEFVCDNLARKKLQSINGMGRANAERFSTDLLMPIGKRLMMSGRVQRGEITRIVQSAVKKLATDPSIINYEHTCTTPSRLSSKEAHRLTYILASAMGTEDWVEFVSNETLISRKRITVAVTNTDFRIHRHALSRYMQREMRDSSDMLKDLTSAMRASVLIGHVVAADTESKHIGIPLNDGMLFGRVTVLDVNKSPPTRMVLDMKGTEIPEHYNEARETLLSDERVLVEIMTYVDYNSLTPLREHLHRVTADYIEKHTFGIKAVFDASYYESTTVVQEEAERIYPSIQEALDDARLLVKTPEWQAFQNNVGANG